ncbi:MAG: phage head-tail adapter protein [Erysipelotrichaceae bacterium]|nr:phage head-tail adapter protein [Erysipelotrichaceae bacterium]
MDVIEAIQSLTGCSEKDAEMFAELAKSDILRETRRTYVPDSLLSTQIDIAVIRYNRRGVEGEASRSEGSLSSSFESLPDYIVALVRSERLAGVGGHAFEKKQPQNILPEKA